MPLVVALEDYRDLFTSDAAMAQFATALLEATREVDTPAVTYRNQHVVTALSPATTQAVLRDRILKRLAERPDLLDRFVDRVGDFKDRDLVD